MVQTFHSLKTRDFYFHETKQISDATSIVLEDFIFQISIYDNQTLERLKVICFLKPKRVVQVRVAPHKKRKGFCKTEILSDLSPE
jgi:hypothetical protein